MWLRILILLVLALAYISIVSGTTNVTIQDIMNQEYIGNISELPYSPGTPAVNWQTQGHIQGWIDITGWRNLSREGDKYFIQGNPVQLAIRVPPRFVRKVSIRQQLNNYFIIYLLSFVFTKQ